MNLTSEYLSLQVPSVEDINEKKDIDTIGKFVKRIVSLLNRNRMTDSELSYGSISL